LVHPIEGHRPGVSPACQVMPLEADNFNSGSASGQSQRGKTVAMICDLCGENRRHVVRVEKWNACNECSAGGPLQAVLAVYDNMVRLRKVVASTAATDVEAESMQKLAENRIGAAQTELAIAINALISVVAKSTEAKLKALHALEELVEFEESHLYLSDEPS